MCDKSNASDIVSEFLQYLETADYSIREEIVLKVAILAEKYVNDYRWYVDVILNLIRIAGDYVSDDVLFRVIQLVVNRDDVQGYASKTAFEALQAPACHENMVRVGGYILGEFGNLIAGDSRSSPMVQFNLLHSKYHLCSATTRALLLSAYIKFVNLFPEIKGHIQDVLRTDSNLKSSDVELQQRSVEYLQLSIVVSPDILATVLEEMPPFPEKEGFLLDKVKNSQSKEDLTISGRSRKGVLERISSITSQQSSTMSPSPSGEHLANGVSPPTLQQAAQQNDSGVLVDIFGGIEATTPSSTSVSTVVDQSSPRFICRNSGVLFENTVLQIGVKSEFKANLSKVSVECKAPFKDCPVLQLQYSHNSAQTPVNVKLPLSINKFSTAYSMLTAEQFFQKWKALGRPEQEYQAVVPANQAMDRETVRGKLTGFGVSVLDGVDPNADNYVCAGILQTVTQIGFLLRVEPNAAAMKYRLTIRSSKDGAAEVLVGLLVTQL